MNIHYCLRNLRMLFQWQAYSCQNDGVRNHLPALHQIRTLQHPCSQSKSLCSATLLSLCVGRFEDICRSCVVGFVNSREEAAFSTVVTSGFKLSKVIGLRQSRFSLVLSSDLKLTKPRSSSSRAWNPGQYIIRQRICNMLVYIAIASAADWSGCGG